MIIKSVTNRAVHCDTRWQQAHA